MLYENHKQEGVLSRTRTVLEPSVKHLLPRSYIIVGFTYLPRSNFLLSVDMIH